MRFIDADALSDEIAVLLERNDKLIDEWLANCIDDVIEAAPTIEAEPVKRGKWIYDNQFHWYRASCSECGYKRVTDIKAEKWNGWKYCPNCGAKMDAEEGEAHEQN